MAGWHRSGWGDAGLRLAGAVLCALSCTAFDRLIALTHAAAGGAGTVTTLGLGTIGFLSASAGAAMLLLGRHLFDEVEVSSRWR